MTTDEKVAAVARHWFGRARDALASADAEGTAGRLAFALNRCCYAAFYAASAVFLLQGRPL